MASTPIVSVLVPTCEGEPFVGSAIQSILGQTLGDLEVVVVDDGSRDGTLDRVAAFRDERIRIERAGPRLGIPGNWNRALAFARGRYVCLFHQDDVMAPTNLAEKVRLLDAHPSAVLVHSAVDVRVETVAAPFWSQWLERSACDFVAAGVSYFRKLLLHGNCICAPSVVMRAGAVADAGVFNPVLHFAADYDMWMRLVLRGDVAYLATPLVTYRWHDANASHAFAEQAALEEVARSAEDALELFRTLTRRVDEASVLRYALQIQLETRRWLLSLEADRAAVQRALAAREREMASILASMRELEAVRAERDELQAEIAAYAAALRQADGGAGAARHQAPVVDIA